MEFCKQWDEKPWEFFGGSKLLWWHRWRALKEETIKAKK